ncbi:hypothetical protein UFOVP938_23 [uncultured Caudovirales phage]|uniref:Uncharacterized protein n=1 Tax=uncultured Caudovirales phage TaxID=2100421 RepID=A0A6J5S279_9CAUD|nr:hypothetical protein UFOVP596_21 [uncultured Caudovirales phage]CAB4172573.1 hypothetical protein UFOVP938_23 [uncultured Caudovirales phage]CAB4183542.1 hypothetical protein UFOVP1104_17 [uncultured Caudovirales phage]CAB4202668.1 hypothetical protein UFOVP1371_30 [uncultured Caudovirales phage]CAB4214793.1 hypothetical protein UFOVP1468_38 [uncultured Caudovirales phage]
MAETKRVLGNTLKTAPRSGVAAFGLSSPVNIKRAEEEFAPMKRAVDEQVAAEALLQKGVIFSKGEEAKAQSALEQGKLQAEEKATKEFATTQRGLVEEAKKKEEKDPFPTFQPTQEDAMSYGQLGSMIATLGVMLGSGGKASAKVALGSMSGMMSGWQKGRKDLWEKEAKTFDKEMSRIKAIRDSITKDLEMGIKLASTDREASRAAYASAAHKAGANSIIAAQINRGQSEAALDSLKSAFKLNQEIDKERRAAAAKQTEREEAERRHREQVAATQANKPSRTANIQTVKDKDGKTSYIDINKIPTDASGKLILPEGVTLLEGKPGGQRRAASQETALRVLQQDIGNAVYNLEDLKNLSQSSGKLPGGSVAFAAKFTGDLSSMILRYAVNQSIDEGLQGSDALMLNLAFDIASAQSGGRGQLSDAKVRAIISQMPLEEQPESTKATKWAALMTRVNEANKTIPDDLKVQIPEETNKYFSGSRYKETSKKEEPHPNVTEEEHKNLKKGDSFWFNNVKHFKE